MPVVDHANENSGLVAYFSHGLEGSDNVKPVLLNKLAKQFLEEPTFNQLRTKEQLGYVVFVMNHCVRDSIGNFILIQSPGKCCSHMINRVNAHMVTMADKMVELSDEDFKVKVGAIMTGLEEKDKNLTETFNRFWGQEFAAH